MQFSQYVYSTHCFKVYSSFEIYHSHDNGIRRNHGITMLDQTDRMSVVSDWQIYHLSRDQKRKSEGQKCNIYNAVSTWMHTKHFISRPLKILSKMFTTHWGKHFLVHSPGVARNLKIHFNGTNISNSQLLSSFPLITPGTIKSPPAFFQYATHISLENNMIRMSSVFRKEKRINRNNFELLLIHTRHFGTVQRKYLWENSWFFLSNSVTMDLEILKVQEEGWQKQVHKKNEKRIDIGTKVWLYSAYTNKRLLHIWCEKQSITECLFLFVSLL